VERGRARAIRAGEKTGAVIYLPVLAPVRQARRRSQGKPEQLAFS
jgi:hypothetical protein